MSKKILATAIVLVTLGGISIPGGFIINNYIRDLTYSSIDEGLLGIKEEALDIIPNSVTDAGPKAILVGLNQLKDEGLISSIPLVNATIFMNQIYTVDDTEGGTGPGLHVGPVINALFWDWCNGSVVGIPSYNFTTLVTLVGYPPLKGISTWYGGDLNFTHYEYNYSSGDTTDVWYGIDRLKFGVNKSGWWGDRLPGIYEDTYRRVGYGDWPPDNITDAWETVDINLDRGFGVLELLDLIKNADKTQLEEMAGVNGYNLMNPKDNFTYKGVEYNKLRILYFYYTDYFIPEAFPLIIPKFNEPSDDPYENPIWFAYPQYRQRDWNGNDTDFYDLAFYSFIEQWAKCNSYDDGADFHDSVAAIPPGTYGLEPGGPGVSSGIPMQAALQLWNETNNMSLLNEVGIYKWYEAYTNNTIKTELLNEFSKYPGYNDTDWNENMTYGEADWGFNQTDMDLLLDWLWGSGGGWNHGSFFEYTLPNLVYDEIAFQILLELWANGTVYGDKIYPQGFALPLGFKDVKGFEIGYQEESQTVIPTNISLESALKLWNTSSEYSLVTKSGLSKWFAALGEDTDAIVLLKSENNLTDEQIDLILEWIPNFQQNVMPYLAQYQMSLPTDSITLGNLIQIGGIGFGAALVGLGGVGLTSDLIVRRKRLNPFEPRD